MYKLPVNYIIGLYFEWKVLIFVLILFEQMKSSIEKKMDQKLGAKK